MSEHIKIIWQAYQRECIPWNAPAVQHEECRRAFYGGAAIIFGILTKVGEQAVSEEAGIRLFEEVSQELRTYAQDMARLARRTGQ